MSDKEQVDAMKAERTRRMGMDPHALIAEMDAALEAETKRADSWRTAWDEAVGEKSILEVRYTCDMRSAESALAAAQAKIERMERVVEAARNATCDSYSGMNCDDDTCANRLLPRVIALYDKSEKSAKEKP